MAKLKTARTLEEAEELDDLNAGYESFAASLITQGDHRFYTLSMPSDVLAFTCTVDRRDENPIDGFQRYLDKKRAQGIADYIDSGLGTIPTSIVLSAQETAQMKYSSSKRTLRFKKVPGALPDSRWTAQSIRVPSGQNSHTCSSRNLQRAKARGRSPAIYGYQHKTAPGSKRAAVGYQKISRRRN